MSSDPHPCRGGGAACARGGRIQRPVGRGRRTTRLYSTVEPTDLTGVECSRASSLRPRPRHGTSNAAQTLNETDLYQAIGEDGFQRLVAAFYRQVPGDDILGPMYPPDDLPGAERRLRDFLVGRFGGPQRYIAERGHPRLRARHMPFAIDPAARDRWLVLMDNALRESALPPDADALLRQFFDAVATMMINRT